MAKVKITGHASGSGVITVTAPNTSTDRTITLPDATDTLIGTATTDAITTRVNATGGRKNIVINGGMNVWQRGTSATIANSSNEGYNTVDRFSMIFGNAAAGAVTWNKSTDVPANQGFGSSLKVDCTTTATADTNKIINLLTAIEGQNVQSFAYGNASPKTATLSFWFKTNKVGVYSVYLEHSGTGTRRSRYSFTPASSGVWEKITINVTGDSVAIPNSSTGYFKVHIGLINSPSYSSSDATVAWGTAVNLTNSSQVNFMDSTSNELYLTGVQLELGSVATDFEHRSYGEELALCQRYYQRLGGRQYESVAAGKINDATDCNVIAHFPQTMRAIPSIIIGTLSHWIQDTVSGAKSFTSISNYLGVSGGTLNTVGSSGMTAGQATTLRVNNDNSYIGLDSEL